MVNSYYTIFYHLAYLIISYYHSNCERLGIGKSRLKELEFVLSLFLLFFISSVLSINGYDKWFFAVSMWIFWFTIISYKSDSLDMNTLIFPIIIFFSEYYEIPFHLFRYMNPAIPYGVNIIAVTIKLGMLLWIMVELRKNNYNHRKFLLDLVIFSIFYFPLSYYIISLQVGRVTLITLKLLCLLFVMYELFKNGEIKEWI